MAAPSVILLFGLMAASWLQVFSWCHNSGFDKGLYNPCGKRGRISLDCVRSYLYDHGDAIPVENGYNFDPQQPADLCMFLPSFNITLFKSDNTYEGLSNTILEDFVVDFDNDVTIIYLNHTSLHAYGPLDIYFHRPGAASLKVSTVADDILKNYTTTTLIPGSTSLDLTKRQTHSYLTTYNVTFGDDNLTKYIKNNALVASVIDAVSKNMPIVLEEVHLTMSKRIADGYIGQNLCDLSSEEFDYPPIL